ncbi:MAG: putative ABC transporter permease [Oscillospiraceae bacterium]
MGIDYNNPALILNAFFLYSFLGWIMECIVIRREKGHWENRGFVHIPFCIIYGFGAMIGYIVLKPFSFNWLLLYVASAVIATAFEFLTANLMLRLFGTLWWNYDNKPFNYRGIVCLESTLGWGIIGILLFGGMHNLIFTIVGKLPNNIASFTAFVLVCCYVVDFAISMRKARVKTRENTMTELEENII